MKKTLSKSIKGSATYNTAQEKRDFKPILIYPLCAIGLGGIVAGILANQRGVDIRDTNVLLIGNVVGLSVAALLFLIIYRQRLALDIKRFASRDYLKYTIICAILMIFCAILCDKVLAFVGATSENQQTVEAMMGSQFILSNIMAVILAPICEEFVFRYSIGSIFKSDWLFYPISVLAFALVHSTGIAMISYAVVAIFTGIVYRKTKNNIVAAIIMHFINNLLATVFFVLGW